MNQTLLSIAVAFVMLSMLMPVTPAFAENDRPTGGREFGNQLENLSVESQSSLEMPSIDPESPITVAVENTQISKLAIKVNESVSNIRLVVQQLVSENFGSYGDVGNLGPSASTENFMNQGDVENFWTPSMSTPWGSQTVTSSQVYHYFKLVAENVTDTQIENVTIEFEVEKSWISEHSIDENTITCNRFENNLMEIPTSGGETITLERLTPVALPTSRLGEDATCIYFTSTSPGLSYFMITGESKDNNNDSSGGQSSGSSAPGIVIMAAVMVSIAVLFYGRRKWA
jgi:hypothetical protein